MWEEKLEEFTWRREHLEDGAVLPKSNLTSTLLPLSAGPFIHLWICIFSEI